MRFKLRVTLMMCVAITLLTPLAVAQSSSNEWQFAIAPYLWAASMDGTMTITEVEYDFDVPFSDIIDNLDLAFMGHFDMRNERWVLSSDLIFVDLESSEDLTEGTVTAGLDMTLLEVAGGYRISPAVTLLAGARWVDMDASLGYAGKVVDDGASAGKSWIDPLVGAQVFAPLSERWWIGLRGDVGGFGVGSELTWQACADIGFKASDLITVFLGYHAIDIDYEEGSGLQLIALDVLVSGPQLGVVFTF